MDFFQPKKASAKGPSAKSSDALMPWIEKYRPRKMDDVAHQEEVVRTLKKSIETSNLPHLLFYGPPGTGKTSTILAIAHELFGPELYRSRILELNASDERGIAVVRDKIKAFAQATAHAVPQSGGHPCPPYKIVILDEADSMTPDAQSALRRTMENFSRSTRFCIICNYVSRIIEPIASRCAKFRFRPLEAETMHARIGHICEQEGVELEPSALTTLSQVSGGDLRKAITLLQTASRFYGSPVTQGALVEMANVMPAPVLQALLAACRSDSFEQVQTAVTDTMALGFSGGQVLSQFNAWLAETSDLASAHKAEIGWQLAQCDHALVDGADEFLQLLVLCGTVQQQLAAMS